MHIYLQSVNHTVPMNKHITQGIQGCKDHNPNMVKFIVVHIIPLDWLISRNDVTNWFIG